MRFMLRKWMMTTLLASALVRGQQPITFDTVRLNTVNSYLIGYSVFDNANGPIVFALGGDGTGSYQTLRTSRFSGSGEHLDENEFVDSRLVWPGSFAPVTSNVEGGYACGLSKYGNGNPISQLYLYLFDNAGDTLSTHLLMEDTTVAVRKCIQTSNGDYVLVGLHEQPKGAFMFRTTAEGDSILFVNFGEPSFIALSVTEDSDQNLFLAGYAENADPNFNQNCYIIKCTPEGEVLWWRSRPRISVFTQVFTTQDNGVLAIGAYGLGAGGLGESMAFVVKYNSEGDELWAQDIIAADNATRPCGLTDGFENPDGSYMVCGQVRNFTLGLNDKGMLHKLDAEGNVLWSRYYAHYADMPLGNDQIFNDVEPSNDGGFILTGETNGPAPPNSHRLWLLKLDSVGCLVPGCNTVGVEEFESELQSALQISPNPASEQVTVDLALPEGYQLEGTVQLMLLDVQGKEVLRRTIRASVAQLRTNVDLSAYPSGLYYVHLRDDRKWLAGGKVLVE